MSLEGDPDSARLRADDDGDKIINLLEANAGEDAFETASSGDDDNDGIPDYWELFHFNTLDHDGSYIAASGGLSLAQAFANATAPTEIDSDGDDWTDKQELDWGWDQNYDQSRDDPKYGPNGDFDGDGHSNRTELLNGSNPSDANSTLDANTVSKPNYAVIDLGYGKQPRMVSNQGHVLNYRVLSYDPFVAETTRWHWGTVETFPDLTASDYHHNIRYMNDQGLLGSDQWRAKRFTVNDDDCVHASGTYYHPKLATIGINGVETPISRPEVENLITANDGTNEYLRMHFEHVGISENDYLIEARTMNVRHEGNDFNLPFHLYYTKDGPLTGQSYTVNTTSSTPEGQTPSCATSVEYRALIAHNLVFPPALGDNGEVFGVASKLHAGQGYASSGIFSYSDTHFFLNNLSVDSGRRTLAINANGLELMDENDIADSSLLSTSGELVTNVSEGRRLKDGENKYDIDPITCDKLTSPESGKPLILYSKSQLAYQKTGMTTDPTTGVTTSELVDLNQGADAFSVYDFEEIFYNHDSDGLPTTNTQWQSPSIKDVSGNEAFLIVEAEHADTGLLHSLLLLKMDLEWISKDPDNNKIDDNPNEGGGKRYHPGKRLPTETDPRNIVTLKVSVPGLAGKQIKLKAFDVDDPTKDVVPFLDADDVDLNGGAGDDNFTDYLSAPKTGQFVYNSASSPTATVTLDEDGEAEIDFQVGMQPGNNYRVVAVIKDIEGNFDQLQVNDTTTIDTFVSADNESIPGFTGAGAASPMLTVWRKLHIEQDSMEAVPTSGSEKNYMVGTIAGVATIEIFPGVFGAMIDLGTTNANYVDDEFVKGRLVIDGEPEFVSSGLPYYEVTDYQSGRIPSSSPGDNGDNALATVRRDVDSSVVGKSFKLYDDDERGLPASHRPLLPRYDLISDEVKSKYKPAYISLIDVDTLGLNPNKTVPFEKHMELNNLLPNVGNNSEDLGAYADDESFWTLLITAAYQGPSEMDGDPKTEQHLEGVLLKNTIGLSPSFVVVFLESMREDAVQLNSDQPQVVLDFQDAFVNEVSLIVAHEIGHSPGIKDAEEEHNEGDLMSDGATDGVEFNAITIKRFREATTWR
ncbi:MAG: hypothetical protein ABF315_02290 [Lentimonas sp.]